MPEVSKEALRDQLKQRKISPVYVLHGEEAYLRDMAAKTIANFSFTETDLRDFNEDEFSLNTPENIRSAIGAADQLPMMAARRVVRVTDVRVAATAQKDTLKEEFENTVGAYLSNPSPHTVLLIIADELNGNRKISKLLKKFAATVEFKRLSDGEMVKWAREKFSELGSRIDDVSARHLISLVGADLRRMTTEIAKLSTAALPENVVTVDHIDDLVPHSRELSNFDLTDHLVAGRKRQALAVMKKILDDGAEPVALLGLISYNFRRLLMAREMMASGADRSDVARVVKLRYGDHEPFLAAARRGSPASFTHIIRRLAETDLAIKTSLGGGGPIGSRMQLEMLVCEIAVSGN